MASTQEKLVEYHISRLKSRRPDVLLDAIAELDALGIHALPALEALKTCHEEVDDPAVKQAAMEVGYRIFMAAKGQ